MARRDTGRLLFSGLSLLLLAACLLFTIGGCKEQASDNPALAPDFKLNIFYGDDKWNGREITLADLKGQPAAIFFTASYCVTCEFMFKFFRPLSERGFFIISVGVIDQEQRFKDKIRSLKVDIPVAFDSDDMANKYEAYTLPLTVFFTPEGKVHKRIHGTFGMKKLEEIFAELKAMTPASI